MVVTTAVGGVTQLEFRATLNPAGVCLHTCAAGDENDSATWSRRQCDAVDKCHRTSAVREAERLANGAAESERTRVPFVCDGSWQ